MPRPTYNLIIAQGATFTLQALYQQPDGVTPVDLSGYSAKLQIRTAYGVADPALLTLTNGGSGGLTMGGVLGTVDILMTAVQTAALVAADYVYDLIITSGAGAVTRLLEGKATVTPRVTT